MLPKKLVCNDTHVENAELYWCDGLKWNQVSKLPKNLQNDILFRYNVHLFETELEKLKLEIGRIFLQSVDFLLKIFSRSKDLVVSKKSLNTILKLEKQREFDQLVELNKTPTMEEEFHRRKVRL